MRHLRCKLARIKVFSCEHCNRQYSVGRQFDPVLRVAGFDIDSNISGRRAAHLIRAGTDTINFNIPGSGPYSIFPSYEFDFISDPVVIDGTTQPGFVEAPIIELDGSGAGPDAHGIFIFAGSSTVRGLVINRFACTGIEIEVNGGKLIQGNYIGTDITGTLAFGNADDGVLLQTSNNIIGGTTVAARNIISGN